MSKAPKKPDNKKSKDVKGKTVSAEKQQNATLFEIVPGKFNENDWNNLLDIDESQEFIWELIDECIDNANKITYASYLESQTIPFTINEAKKAILHLIDWQFLGDDVNDDLTETWFQDEEPEPCMIDSWAQGYVQTVLVESIDFEKNTIEEGDEQKSLGCFLEDLTQVPQSKEEFTTAEESFRSQTSEPAPVKPIVTLRSHPQVPPLNKHLNKKFETYMNQPMMTPSLIRPDPSCFSQERTEKKELPVHLKFKQIDAEAKKLEDSIVKAPTACQSLLKTLLTRPIGMREVEIDPLGNISSMAKLDYDKMHSNVIKPRFLVNESSRAESTLEPTTRRTRNSVFNNEIKLSNRSVASFDKPTSNTNKSHHKSPPRRKAKISDMHHEEETELVLEPVPGVVFTMLNSIRSGPKKTLVPNRQQALYDKSEIFLKPIKPLERDETFTRMSLEEILENTHQINPLKKNSKLKPMPPISQNSTAVN